MTISLKSTVERKIESSPAIGPDLTRRIVDPDALRGGRTQVPAEPVSSIDAQRGLSVNMSTLERARRIFRNLFGRD